MSPFYPSNQFISFPLLRRPSFVIVPPEQRAEFELSTNCLWGALTRDLRHGRQRVAPFYHISQLSHSRDSDFQSLSSPGFLTPKMTGLTESLATRLIIGLDFAVTLSSLDSFCVLFDITS